MKDQVTAQRRSRITNRFWTSTALTYVPLEILADELVTEKPDEALRLGQQAAELAPDDPAVQDTLGWAYFHKGLYESALGYLKSAYAKQPTPMCQYHLAMGYLKSGNQEQGIKNLQAALARDPSLAKTR
jgi:tetratricopeptide (TPR) repeat protein